MHHRLLDETTAQNHRIRQLLNRVAAGVKEYEMIQSSVMKSLGIQHTNLPSELLEAFGHDPAAVTGSTRKFRGWEAVDDIHNRLTRQRETFQNFLSQFANGGVLSAPGSVLEGPISSLLKSLETLETQRQEIVEKAKEVAEVLTKTKAIHATVKADYNDTLSHTSVVYPEVCCRPIISPYTLIHNKIPALSYRRVGGKLQGSISTVLGVRDGCLDVLPRLGHSFLENVRQDYR